MSHNVPWKSDTKAIVHGATMDLFDFVPVGLVGPNKGRIVVDRFVVCVQGTITVATATWDGRDVPRLASLITVEQRDGIQRWNLSGYKSRIKSIELNGIEQHQEHGTVAIGAAQTVDLRLIIPMTKPYIVRGKDFSLPADMFKKITFSWAPLASAATGTTVLSASSLNCYVLAEWHEETNLEFKCCDVVKSVDFTNATQAKLSLSGAVHDLLLVKEDTTAGGASITTVTDIRCEDLGTPLLTRGDYVHSYSTKRGIAPSGPTTPATERFLDPIREGKALPFLVADYDTSAWDGKVIDAMKLDLTTGLAGLSVITREIVAKTQTAYAMQVARFNVNPSMIRMKTDGKSRRALGEWSKYQLLVGCWSAPLPKAA